jgi:hypothetical protein
MKEIILTVIAAAALAFFAGLIAIALLVSRALAFRNEFDRVMRSQSQPTGLHPGKCRVCGCTDYDCRGCIARTGQLCSWANKEHTLCSACAPNHSYVSDEELRDVETQLEKLLIEGNERQALLPHPRPRFHAGEIL